MVHHQKFEKAIRLKCERWKINNQVASRGNLPAVYCTIWLVETPDE